MEHIKLMIAGKEVGIYPGKAPNCPVIYLNTVSAQSESVMQEIEKIGCPDFSLAAISNLEWNRDMAPWDIPPISKNDAMTHTMKKQPEHLYLSLGDRECKTKNPYLEVVQTNTEELFAFYRSRQIDTEFMLHPGGHFTEPVQRSALGMKRLLTR